MSIDIGDFLDAGAIKEVMRQAAFAKVAELEEAANEKVTEAAAKLRAEIAEQIEKLF